MAAGAVQESPARQASYDRIVMFAEPFWSRLLPIETTSAAMKALQTRAEPEEDERTSAYGCRRRSSERPRWALSGLGT